MIRNRQFFGSLNNWTMTDLNRAAPAQRRILLVSMKIHHLRERGHLFLIGLDRFSKFVCRYKVNNLSGVLKPMIETVDRRGLKKPFLRKHRSSVHRFYSRLCDWLVTSKAAEKLVNRPQKNCNKMFTVLDFDDVPWNNNNAEHALVFVVVDGDKSEVVAFEKLDDGKAPDGDTVYEIGSVTKTFSAALGPGRALQTRNAQHAGGTTSA